MAYVKSKKMRFKKRRVRKTKRIRGGSTPGAAGANSGAAGANSGANAGANANEGANASATGVNSDANAGAGLTITKDIVLDILDKYKDNEGNANIPKEDLDKIITYVNL